MRTQSINLTDAKVRNFLELSKFLHTKKPRKMQIFRGFSMLDFVLSV